MTRYVRVTTTLALAVLLLGGLEACGRRGDPHPPEGEEANYNFPGFYPNWEGTLAPRRGAVEETDERVGENLKPAPVPPRRQPDTSFTLENDGFARSRTTVY